MAQEVINVGTVANDRTGDTWRASMIKTNNNFDQLFADTAVFIAQESDFPTQDATTITLESKTAYVITADISTAKNFICNTGSSMTSRSIDGPRVTFTGTGAMFSGTDNGFFIHDMPIDAGVGAEAFNFNDTIGFLQRFICENVTIISCAKVATFEDMFLSIFVLSNALAATQGIEYKGTAGGASVLDRFAMFSTNAAFKGVDLGTSSVLITEFNDVIFDGPAGAFGISGLANSGNIPVGRLAMVTRCEFTGGITDLQNITVDDIRWFFTGNSPTPDTNPDGLLSLTANATNTVISAVNTPTLVTGTWVVEDTSHFTGTTGGRLTYIGERDLRGPISIVFDFEPASGVNKDLKGYIALNGTQITQTGRLARVDANNPQSITTIWQVNFTTNDYIELFVENTTDAIDILVSGAVSRIR